MKNVTLTLLFCSLILIINAQAPHAFSYQAVIRNNDGTILSNQNVSFRISILQGGTSGMAVYTETQNTVTNTFGLVSLEIGNGTIESGVFEDLDWGRKTYFIQVELDETGNSNYQLMGTSQLLSVPYVLNSTSLTLTSPNGATWDVTLDENANLLTTCFPMPTPADAGTDQSDVCIPTLLEGNTPVDGIGIWTIESGTSGIIEEPNNPSSQFSGIMDSLYILRWTISNLCDTSYDEIHISFLAPPTTAVAGTDQPNAPNPTCLAANSPTFGTGQWTIISGTGGIIEEPFNPNTIFTGIVDSSYVLRWTISTACSSNSDDVNIIIGFECPLTITDIDGNTYNTVPVGSQCWMKENLKTTTYRNGTPIPNVTDNTAWGSLTSGAYIWYNNDMNWKDKYGALYNWFTTVDGNGLCPAGWHVPSYNEVTTFVNSIGGSGSPHGNELKSCRQVNSPLGGNCNTSEHPRWNEDPTNYGTNSHGFSGLPGGNRFNSGTFSNLGGMGFWWTSTGYSNNAYVFELLSSSGDVIINSLFVYKQYGHSVRCLRD